jgi:exonuclease III
VDKYSLIFFDFPFLSHVSRLVMVHSWLVAAFVQLFLFQVSAVNLRVVSWNVNGVQKLKVANHELKFLGSFDVVFLQETFATTPDSTLDLHGFIPHHQLGRRHQWGLSSLFRINALTGGTLHRLPCPFDWLVISRWRQETDLGCVFVNAYLPTHTDGFSRNDAEAAIVFLRSIQDDFPSDGFVLGGDLNVDPWRVALHRTEGRTISSRTRFVSYF